MGWRLPFKIDGPRGTVLPSTSARGKSGLADFYESASRPATSSPFDWLDWQSFARVVANLADFAASGFSCRRKRPILELGRPRRGAENATQQQRYILMFKQAVFHVSAIAIGLLGSGQLAMAQLYGAPTVSSMQGLYQPPNINSNNANLTSQRLNAAYGGTRSARIYSNLPGVGVNATRLALGVGGSGRASKPFSGVSSAPTVSPYLNLFRTDLNSGGNFNYSTLVQPQLQQLQTNSQLERQNIQNNRRLTSIAAQADFNPQGSKDQFPTGHQTVFNYMGHYFPAAQVRQKRAGR
jgi:hypothetical protein